MTNCHVCYGSRFVMATDQHGGADREVCPECQGSGLPNMINVTFTVVGYQPDARDNKELILYETDDLPADWLTSVHPWIQVGVNGRLYLRMGKELDNHGKSEKS